MKTGMVLSTVAMACLVVSDGIGFAHTHSVGSAFLLGFALAGLGYALVIFRKILVPKRG